LKKNRNLENSPFLVKRRDKLRTDRRIVLRNGAKDIPRTKMRSWIIEHLRALFSAEESESAFFRHRSGILIVVEAGKGSLKIRAPF